MGRLVRAALYILCLISEALIPGEALEQSNTPDPQFLSESSLVPLLVSLPAEEPTWSPRLSEHLTATQGPRGAETSALTEAPESAADVSTPSSVSEESDSRAAVGSRSPEVITGSVETVSDSNWKSTVQNNMEEEVTSAVHTRPTPSATPTPKATDDETLGPVESSTEILPLHTQKTPEVPPSPSTPGTPPIVTTQAIVTTASFYSTWMAAITTSMSVTTRPTTASPTSPPTRGSTLSPTTRAQVQRRPSVLDVGEDEKDLPTYYPKNNSNPLFVMIVAIFTIMVVMIVVVVGFHRYRRRNNRTEFRRLQDLPMDDMMEDTPLSLYSY
ncbi:mucin-2-like [Spea bombifrons]|uniref:mucin-2-like n=1 Tax=Spea bombifrons TaxID=233779 RepID=UPI00234A70CE|nr:mucin-2-like [Spea bombifrons]